MKITDLNISIDPMLKELKEEGMRLNREGSQAFPAGIYTAKIDKKKSYLARGEQGAMSYTISIEVKGPKNAKKKFMLGGSSFTNYIKNNGELNKIGGKALNQMAIAQGLEDLYAIEFEKSSKQFKGGKSTKYDIEGFDQTFRVGLREVDFFATPEDKNNPDATASYTSNEIELILPSEENMTSALAAKAEEAIDSFNDRVESSGKIKRVAPTKEDDGSSGSANTQEDDTKKAEEAKDLAASLL